MFVKNANLMLNLHKVHVKLEDNTLKFYESIKAKPVHVVTYQNDRIANFAYGRIIHAILLHWGAVEVTEHIIVQLMEKKENTEENKS